MSDTTTSGAEVANEDAMVNWWDAVADDPEMTPDQKIHWLRITAADYSEKIDAQQARLAAADAVIAVVRGVVFPDTDRDDIFELRAALAAYDAPTAPRQEGV